MRPPKRARPVIALLTLNEATEVTDFLVPYGVLQRANVADVTVVAERAAPVPLHPFSRLGRAQRCSGSSPSLPCALSTSAIRTGPTTLSFPLWSRATIRSSWSGSSPNTARCQDGGGLRGRLDGGGGGPARRRRADALGLHRRAATGASHHAVGAGPALCRRQWHPHIDRHHGLPPGDGDPGEAIAGRPQADRLAQELGVVHWDARHRSSGFQLTLEHQKTFVRNWLAFWRRETLGVPVREGVDEIALGLTVDAYARTALSTVVTVGRSSTAVRSGYGLMIHPTTSGQPAAVDHRLPPPRSEAPALTIDRELAHIAARFDRPTAEIVALVMEYAWSADPAPMTR